MDARRIGLLLALVWAVALAVAYAIMHPPFGLETALAMGRSLLDAAAVAGLAVLSGALGTRLVRGLDPLSHLERTAVQTLAGLAAISVMGMALGLIGLFPPRWLAWAGLVTAIALLRRSFLAWWADLQAGLAEALAPEPDRLGRWSRRAVFMLLGLAAVLALAPPTMWDALTYHLVAPQEYLRAGRIVSVPENHFLGFPQLAEMLYLWLMILARANAAALLHAVFGALVLALMLGLARRTSEGNAPGWLATGVMLASTTVWKELAWPYNDLVLAAYTTGALVFLLAWEKEPGGRMLAYAGLFAGCMMGTKYTAAPYTVGLGLLALWLARRGGLRRTAGALGVVTLAAVLAFAPWLLKNLITDGNPVSPFLLTTGEFDQTDLWHYLLPEARPPLVDVLLVPVGIAVVGQEGGAFQGSTGGLLIGLLPLMALGWRQRDPASRALVARLLIFALPGFCLWWAATGVSRLFMQTRLLLPVLPTLALVGAYALWGLEGRGIPSGFAHLIAVLVGAMLALALASAAWVFAKSSPARVIAGLQSEHDYLTEQLQSHYLAMEAVSALPDEARILFLWEPRVYYCRGRCTTDSMINRWWQALGRLGDPERVAACWRDEGYSHVLVFNAGARFLIDEQIADPLTQEHWDALMSLRGHTLVPIWDELSSYTLYELHVPPGIRCN